MGKRITNCISSTGKKILIVILGPTASGKTSTSIELAKHLEIEVISADSRQVYRYLDIGTAKPDRAEQEAVKHHFVDIIYPDEYYSAGIFAEQGVEVIDNIYKKKKIPVIVGGSGLYIKALCEGLFEETEVNIDDKLNIRKSFEKRLNEKGIDDLYQELERIDPISAQKYIDKNPRRIIRALEYHYITGESISQIQKREPPERNFVPVYFGIQYDRKKLYERINIRAEKMWSEGLIEETEKILKMGYSPELNSLNSVGYKECIAFLKGELSAEEALEKMKQNTRRYAKRQLTWFRKLDNINWLAGDSMKIANKILNLYLTVS